ncbi:LysR family transcriptional regulator [Pseudooceanicola sp. HF7]|uniref:LysR family transcriptional regulator n=1 Tax=Pseudooceanicola sp. HF7 TaxID=2721560 RepID=UPI0014313A54|nr:LysR family transcriptional regulator [Pseudooceanicola sp. HF7]
MNFQALSTFLKVAETGSVSVASRLHGQAKSSISLKLKQLEEEVGAELFTRRGRALELTDAGRVLVERGQHILSLCDDTAAAVASMQDEAAGVLRVGASGEFGTALNAQMLQAFRAVHPKIQLDLVFFSPSVFLDMSRQKVFDAVLSFEDVSGPGAEELTTLRYALHASPSYLEAHGMPTDVADLARHKGVIYRDAEGLRPWRLSDGTRSEEILPPADIVTNDYWTTKYFAVAGAGLALLPAFFTELEVREGHLVPVLPDWRSEERSITLRVPDPRYVAPKTRAFIAFCKSYFQPGFDFAGPRYFVEALRFPDPTKGERE